MPRFSDERERARKEESSTAKTGETWILKRNDGSTMRLTFGERAGYKEWFYPGTGRVYDRQDLVGLLRKIEE